MTNRRTWQTALLWVVALVIVNALWLNVVDQSAPNEINAENQFQTHREIDISSVFGNDDPIPAELTTRFSSTSLDNANLSVAIKKGQLDRCCIVVGGLDQRGRGVEWGVGTREVHHRNPG